jgi:D-lactate dehydrogenase (cytochrome)
MSNRIPARRPRDVDVPPVMRDDAVVAGFLDDAAHVAGGFADGVAFPATESEVAALVASAERVLPVGAQSSLTGGATPRGDLVLSTRALTRVDLLPGDLARVGAGVPLAALQRTLAASGRYYPPVPTFDGAFVGGTIATNAAGPATFKYGSTRRWVRAITVVLASGDVLDVVRGTASAASSGFEIERPSGDVVRVPLPTYAMPPVAKLSAGYFAAPGMDLIDLFIGAEGTLGVIVDATLATIALPRRLVALVRCRDEAQMLTLTAALRDDAECAWRGEAGLDVSAIEYVDARAVALLDDAVYVRAGIPRPREGVLLILQAEIPGDDDVALARLQHVLETSRIADDPTVAMPGDERAAARLFELRESVPAAVNGRVAAAKARIDAGIEKTAGDMVVPFERLADALATYRRQFEDRGLAYAVWGHVSDGNLHPNVIPASLDDVRRGREALLAIAHDVMAMGGAPLAEHGVGRSALKQQLLRELYGVDGIEEMRRVKHALDPEGKLAAGVLFPG